MEELERGARRGGAREMEGGAGAAREGDVGEGEGADVDGDGFWITGVAGSDMDGMVVLGKRVDGGDAGVRDLRLTGGRWRKSCSSSVEAMGLGFEVRGRSVEHDRADSGGFASGREARRGGALTVEGETRNAHQGQRQDRGGWR